jgi:MscS family membrane protein
MVTFFSETLDFHPALNTGLLVLIGALAALGGHFFPKVVRFLVDRLLSHNAGENFGKLIQPYENLAWVFSGLLFAEIIISFLSIGDLYPWVEIPISLAFTVVGTWLVFQLVKQFFDVYVLDYAVKSGRRFNSDLLIVGKLVAYFIVVVLAIILFAQAHQINIFGLIASLGIGGLAVAVGAQKILEQILSSVVIYVDRPFVVDDYISLPDGTFGRVESIGLRSTRIRTSGKGTVMIVPNNVLTQVNIENFTGAKKVMSIVNLTLYETIASKEHALIRQIILQSTANIFGLDSRSTDVIFKEISNSSDHKKTQIQITFFILGSGEVSMELRRQILSIATQNITQKLKEYGVDFDIEEPNIYVESPITV